MVFRLATGAVVEVVIPFSLAKAGLFSGCPVVLGIVAASEMGAECRRRVLYLVVSCVRTVPVLGIYYICVTLTGTWYQVLYTKCTIYCTRYTITWYCIQSCIVSSS